MTSLSRNGTNDVHTKVNKNAKIHVEIFIILAFRLDIQTLYRKGSFTTVSGSALIANILIPD